MKKISIIVLLFSLVAIGFVPFTTLVHAENAVKVEMNGELMTFPDQQPIINQDGRTIVPVRFVAVGLGAYIAWDGQTQTVTISKGSDTIKLTIGEKQATKNGQVLTFDTSASIVNSRTMVPLRFVSEGLGAYVAWDGATKTVIVKTKAQDTTGSQTGGTAYTPNGDDVFTKANITDLTNIYDPNVEPYGYKVVDHTIQLYDFSDYSGNTNKYHILEGTMNPNINTQVYNVTRALIGKEGYVGITYPNENAVIRYGYNETGVNNDITFFTFDFNEKLYYSAKRDWQDDRFSDKVVFELELYRLYESAADGYVNDYYKQRLHDAIIGIFGKETGEKVFNEILYEYNDLVTHPPEVIRRTYKIDNVQVDVGNTGRDMTLHFFFSYIK